MSIPNSVRELCAGCLFQGQNSLNFGTEIFEPKEKLEKKKRNKKQMEVPGYIANQAGHPFRFSPLALRHFHEEY